MEARRLVLSVLLVVAMSSARAPRAGAEATPAAGIPATYTIQELLPLADGTTGAAAVNAAGVAVGSSRTEDGTFHPVMWADGRVTDLGTLGGPGGAALGVNDAGQVVGYTETANGPRRAFRWDRGTMTDLGALGPGLESAAVAVNGAGVAVGYGQAGAGALLGGTGSHALSWDAAGAVTDLGTLGGATSLAHDVNDAGVVVGEAEDAQGRTRAVRWVDGAIEDLGTLGGETGRARAINAAGQIAGDAQDADGNVRAVVWEPDGTITDLGTLGGTRSFARDINDAGTVVGGSGTAEDGVPHAFVWARGRMEDLGALIPPGTGWVLEVASQLAINDAGAIVGGAALGDTDHHRAFLLTPAPGP